MRAARYGLSATYWIAQFLRYLFLWYISFASPIFGAFLTYISNIHCRPCHWSVRLDLQTRSAQNSHLPQSASYTNPLSSDHSSLSKHFVQIGLSSDISSKPEEQSSEASEPVRQLFPTPPEIFEHKPPSLLEVCWLSYQHPEPRCDTLFCTSWLVAPKIELKSWSTNLCDISTRVSRLSLSRFNWECSKVPIPLWLGSLRQFLKFMGASRCWFKAGSLKVYGEFILSSRLREETKREGWFEEFEWANELSKPGRTCEISVTRRHGLGTAKVLEREDEHSTVSVCTYVHTRSCSRLLLHMRSSACKKNNDTLS